MAANTHSPEGEGVNAQMAEEEAARALRQQRTADYLGRVAELRVSINQKLSEYNALSQDSGSAVFDIPPGSLRENSPLSISTNRKQLWLKAEQYADPNHKGRVLAPVLRLVSQ